MLTVDVACMRPAASGQKGRLHDDAGTPLQLLLRAVAKTGAPGGAHGRACQLQGRIASLLAALRCAPMLRLVAAP